MTQACRLVNRACNTNFSFYKADTPVDSVAQELLPVLGAWPSRADASEAAACTHQHIHRCSTATDVHQRGVLVHDRHSDGVCHWSCLVEVQGDNREREHDPSRSCIGPQTCTVATAAYRGAGRRAQSTGCDCWGLCSEDQGHRRGPQGPPHQRHNTCG